MGFTLNFYTGEEEPSAKRHPVLWVSRFDFLSWFLFSRQRFNCAAVSDRMSTLDFFAAATRYKIRKKVHTVVDHEIDNEPRLPQSSQITKGKYSESWITVHKCRRCRLQRKTRHIYSLSSCTVVALYSVSLDLAIGILAKNIPVFFQSSKSWKCFSNDLLSSLN